MTVRAPRRGAGKAVEPMLELRNVSKSFGGKKVLDGVSLALDEGSRTALLGPSGTGKSTLLRVVAGLEAPDGGEVWIGGQNVTERPPEARGAALIFQDYALFDNYDVAGNVAFSLKIRRRPRREIAAAVAEMLALVGLSGFESRAVRTLSGGEKQRVALARVLAARPRLILMDEPFSGLDAALRGSVLDSTRELLAAQGCTSVIVTHDWNEACAFGSRVAVMDGGAAVLIGSDLPYLTAPVFSRAFALLEDHDVVLGPSADGGYYLIGMKAPRRELFDVNGYGGATALGQTLAAARRAGLSAALCPVGRDVDDKEDLLELAAAVERGETACPRTAGFLRGIGLARGARP